MPDWTELNEKAAWYGMFCCGCLLYGLLALLILAIGFVSGAFIFHY